MWFGQTNYNDIQGINGKYTIHDIGCFLTAFCNLEQRFGKTIDPSSLNKVFRDRGIYIDVDDGVRDDLGWASITAYDGQVQIEQLGGAGWPPHTNAIVKFAYTSPKTGHAMTHFCLVADPTNQTIIDSWDGQIRQPGYYGQPVAWASYKNVVPEPVIVPPVVAAPKSNATTGQVVVLQRGDTIAAIALRYGFQASDVLAHNGLSWDDARHLPVGYELRLPVASATVKPADQGYTIEVLSAPRKMHTNKPTQKWAFANVKQWKDFVSNGAVPANTNVDVVAIATVLVSGTSAAYYLDALALGDYKTTGHLANTIGINWADLTDGEYSSPAPAPAPAPVAPEKAPEAPQNAPQKAPVAVPAPVTKPEPKLDPNDPTNPDHYKTTYKVWAKPLKYLILKDSYAYELDGKRPQKALHKNQEVSIAGSFIKNDILYGRPAGAAKAFTWWGIPMDNLISEDEVFNTTVSLPEKVAMHYALSLKEKVVVSLSRIIASLAKLQDKTKK